MGLLLLTDAGSGPGLALYRFMTVYVYDLLLPSETSLSLIFSRIRTRKVQKI